MSKTKLSIIVAVVAVILAVMYFSLRSQSAPHADPQAFAALQGGDPPPSGGCSQCLAGNCYSAPCNMDCILLNPGCETRVMGGAQQEYTPDTRKSGGDYAEFLMQRVLKNNEAMQAAGVELGDSVIRVNGVYAGSDLEFAKLVLRLPKGTVLLLWKSTGEKVEVTL